MLHFSFLSPLTLKVKKLRFRLTTCQSHTVCTHIGPYLLTSSLPPSKGYPKIPQKEMGTRLVGAAQALPLGPCLIQQERSWRLPAPCGHSTWCSHILLCPAALGATDPLTQIIALAFSKLLLLPSLLLFQLILNAEAVMTLSLQRLPSTSSAVLRSPGPAQPSLPHSPVSQPLIPLFTLLLGPLAPFLFLNHSRISRTLQNPPESKGASGLCTCYFLFLFVLPANTCVTPSLPDFKSLSHFYLLSRYLWLPCLKSESLHKT